MSLFKRLWPFGRKATGTLDLWRDVYGLPGVKSGQVVNWTTALQCTTALAACRVLAEGMAQLPAHVRRSRDGAGSDVVRDHPLARLIDRGPNGWQTWFEFVECLTLNAVLGRGGFALIQRGVDGRVIELLPVPSLGVTVKRRADWSVYYEVDLSAASEGNSGARVVVERGNMLHLRGPSLDGYRALEGIRYAREAIGLSLATEEAHARLHANGVQPSGLYTVDGTLSFEQHERLSAHLEAAFSGANASRAMIMDRATKWVPLAMNGVDAQHLETRRFQIEEVCRAFRVLPIMVGYSDKATTYASAEQMFLAHVVHSLMPWVRRWESTVARDLISDRDAAAGLYYDVSVQGMLRGDAKTRSEFYQKAVLSGWMTRNEVRDLEELNPLPGLDEPLTAVNMAAGAPASQEDQAK